MIEYREYSRLSLWGKIRFYWREMSATRFEETRFIVSFIYVIMHEERLGSIQKIHIDQMKKKILGMKSDGRLGKTGKIHKR